MYHVDVHHDTDEVWIPLAIDVFYTTGFEFSLWFFIVLYVPLTLIKYYHHDSLCCLVSSSISTITSRGYPSRCQLKMMTAKGENPITLNDVDSDEPIVRRSNQQKLSSQTIKKSSG